MMKKLICLTFGVLSGFSNVVLGNLVPADILSYHINLTFREMTEERIAGYCDIHLKKLSSKPLKLELADLEAEKVVHLSKNKKLAFKPEKDGFTLNLPPDLPGDTLTIRVHYQGKPGKPSRFGGVYFSKDFIYNLGVAIDRIPHCYGKVWFPCVDNFTDKALYRFSLTVPAGKTAVCNGSLVSQTTDAKTGMNTWNWKLRDPIPTYLASFAVGDYSEVKDVYPSISGENIPISIYVVKGKEDAARGSFRNLKKAAARFERYFGDYAWERIGYVAVPMTGGAMEHATNIAYPTQFIDSTMKSDRLWVHELSHSWFGNLVTCFNAGDMWLNEGFARWCEAFYEEEEPGPEVAKAHIRKLCFDVFTRTHISDGDYRAVAGIPEEHTYGSTVYDKGALMVHSLRGQLGDSAFFKGIKVYLAKYRFSNARTEDLLEVLERSSGKKLKDFFDVWIKLPGHISLSSEPMQYNKVSDGKYLVSYAINQEFIHKEQPSRMLTVDLLFLGGQPGEVYRQAVSLSDRRSKFTSIVPFLPYRIVIDPDDVLADACAQTHVSLTKARDFLTPGCKLNVTETQPVKDLYIKYSFITPAYEFDGLSGYATGRRFWEFSFTGKDDAELNLNSEFSFKIKDFFFNATTEQFTLNPQDVKPLALLYRQSPNEEWTEIQRLEPGNFESQLKNDELVTFKVLKIKQGQYTAGYVLE